MSIAHNFQYQYYVFLNMNIFKELRVSADR